MTGDSSQGERILYGIMLGYLVIIVFFVLLAIPRRHNHPLKIRPAFLHCAENLSFVLAASCVYIGRIWPHEMYCGIWVYCILMGYIVGPWSFSLRAFYYYFIFNWNVNAMKYGNSKSMSRLASVSGQSELNLVANDRFRNKSKYTNGYFKKRVIAMALLVSVVIGIGLAANPSYAAEKLSERSCRAGGFSVYLITMIVGIVCTVICFRVGKVFKNIEDNFGVHKNFTNLLESCVFTALIGGICLIPQVFEASETKFQFIDFMAFGMVTLGAVEAAILPVLETYSKKYRIAKILDSKMGSEEMANESRQKFLEIIDDEEGFELFKDYVIHEFASENLLFWLAAKKYRVLAEIDQVEDGIDPERQGMDAQNIYEMFVVDDSPNMVNVSWAVRAEVENNIRMVKEGTAFPDDYPHIFERAESEILRLMVGDSFMRFRTTAGYKEWLAKHDV